VSDAAPAAPMADLKSRVASALLMAAAALAATWWGDWPFAIIWLVAAALAATEFLAMVGARGRAPLLLSLVSILLSGFWAHDLAQAPIRSAGAPLLFLFVALVIGGALAGLTAARGARRWAAFAAPCAGLIAIVPIVGRSDHVGGLSLICWLFATVWFTDIAAYFAGRAIGGPKLWPAVSPKKTWAGAVGGMIAGVLAGVAVLLWLGRPPLFASWSMASIVAFTLVATLMAEAGDLAESAMKRKFQVKDSGHLIPGHGGLMDRLDGFWAVCLLLGLTMLITEG